MQTFEDADSNNFVLGPAEIEFGQNKYDAFWYLFWAFNPSSKFNPEKLGFEC